MNIVKHCGCGYACARYQTLPIVLKQEFMTSLISVLAADATKLSLNLAVDSHNFSTMLYVPIGVYSPWSQLKSLVMMQCLATVYYKKPALEATVAIFQVEDFQSCFKEKEGCSNEEFCFFGAGLGCYYSPNRNSHGEGSPR